MVEKAVTKLRDASTQTEEPWRQVRFRPAWVETRNERQFLALMEVMIQGAGEGRFGVVWDQAGRGKTRTTARWAAQHRVPHILMLDIWRKKAVSPMGFLHQLCRELGASQPPRSLQGAFQLAVERLLDRPPAARLVFLDEMDKTPNYLDLVRDLAELSDAGFILIGEESMPALMAANRRVWSRTLDAVRFEGADAPAIVSYAHAAAGLRLTPEGAHLLAGAAGGGDWRVIRKRLMKLIALANAKRTLDMGPDLVRLVLSEEMKGDRR